MRALVPSPGLVPGHQQPSRVGRQAGCTPAPEFRKALCCAWPSASSRQWWRPVRARWGWTRSRYECPESQAKITTAAGLSHRQDVIEGILSPAGGRKGSWYSFRYLPVAAFYKLTAWETRCLQGEPVLLEPGEWGFIPGSTTLERVTVPSVPSVSSSAKQGS